MDLRTGSPAAERRTWSRSLRGAILARPSPSCAHDDDRVRLPPASPPRNSKAGKKESAGHHLSRLCRPCATPSSNSSLGYRRSGAHIAENGFATSCGVNKSAKVVLGRVLINCSRHIARECRLCFRKRRKSERDREPDLYYVRNAQLPATGQWFRKLASPVNEKLRYRANRAI